MASLIFRSAGILSVFLLIFACAADNPGAVNSFDGTPIKFEVAGAGDVTLVFVSGWGGNRKDWFRQVEYFSPKYRVVTVDPAGFGESGSSRQDWTIPNFGRDVTAVIEELDAERIILIGFSMGGFVGLETARLVPDRVMGLVPVDVFHDVEAWIPGPQIERRVASFMGMVRSPTRENVASLFSKEADPSLIDRVIRDWSSASLTGWEESLDAVFRYMNASDELKNSLSEVHCPICCILSDQQAAHPENARKYAPDFRIKTVSGTGHIIMWEKPDEFNRLLAETIKEMVRDDE